MHSLRYLCGLAIVLGIFAFGSCPVRNAIGNAKVTSDHTCAGYTTDETSLYYAGTSAVNPIVPLPAVLAVALFPGTPLFDNINVLHDALSAPGVKSIPIYLRNRVWLV